MLRLIASLAHLQNVIYGAVQVLALGFHLVHGVLHREELRELGLSVQKSFPFRVLRRAKKVRSKSSGLV